MNKQQKLPPTKLQQYSGSLLIIISRDQVQKKVIEDFLNEQNLLSKNRQTHLQWLNQENETLKIKLVRQLIKQSSYGSYDGQTQYFVLANIETASPAAQNALLKIIEEPPPNSRLILTTQNPQQILPTIKSRCLSINLTPKTSETKKIDDNLAHALKLITHPQQMKYADAIELAQQYKDRAEALQLVSGLLHKLKTMPAQKSFITAQQLLLKTYSELQHNFNVRLSLEECFFRIKHHS